MSGLGRKIDVSLRPVVGPVVRRSGALTSGLRTPPSVLMVGTQRGGTTSLFRALRQHPGFLGPTHRKGVHYFDVEYARGHAWYLGHFPLRRTVARRARSLGHPVVVGEASPYYMAHPWAASRIAVDLPGVRTVVLLRDPIERAWSAYAHEKARGYEDRPFEEAVAAEPATVAAEIARTLADPDYQSAELRHNAFLTRGHYVDQLERLAAEVGRDNILVVDSHRYFDEPEAQFSRLLEFLGLPEHPGISHDRHNARSRLPLTAEMHEELRAHFQPYDEALATWLGWRPSWMTQAS